MSDTYKNYWCVNCGHGVRGCTCEQFCCVRHEPSPEEIRLHCLKLQEKWTDADWMRKDTTVTGGGVIPQGVKICVR